MLAQTITEEHSIVFYTGVLYKQLEIVNCIQSTNDDDLLRQLVISHVLRLLRTRVWLYVKGYILRTCIWIVSHIYNAYHFPSGLVLPMVAQTLFGRAGEMILIVMMVMAVVSTGSAEVIAVTSIIVYDIYQLYLKVS